MGTLVNVDLLHSDPVYIARLVIFERGRIELSKSRMVPKSPVSARGMRDAATYNALAEIHRNGG